MITNFRSKLNSSTLLLQVHIEGVNNENQAKLLYAKV